MIVRDMTPIGLMMLIFGISYGGYHWYGSSQLGTPTPAGTVMVAAMPMLMGLQFVLAFIGYDIASVPKRVLHRSRSQWSSIVNREIA